MKNVLLFDFTVDKATNSIHVNREFDASVPLVWDAWTKPELLDLWWAPKPYRTETKSMDFRVGGRWLYSMVSPTDERHWCKADYLAVTPGENFQHIDAFCDEEGNTVSPLPNTHWTVQFTAAEEKTLVTIKLEYQSLSDLEAIIQMGFKEGFTMAMENLDQYLEARFRLHKENKTDNKARVSTYLNFPGNTEEAMLFYKSVFRTEFVGKGLQRFGEIPEGDGNPPIPDAIKDMILHVELPITGGHILMATDAPKEMGFTLNRGNNMHICIEPESREEAKRIFDELSSGGTVTMPLEDMFFGAYFGEFSDKYGINWMINYRNAE